MVKHRRRLFTYPMNVAQDSSGFIGELPDWPECDPVGLTREAVHEEAIGSISDMAIARMRDGEPLPLRGAAPAGWENEVLVKLPWRQRLVFFTYEVMRVLRELVNR
jgi:predicted RNase H-like HicB family nuclease